MGYLIVKANPTPYSKEYGVGLIWKPYKTG